MEIVNKPWGWYKILTQGEGFLVKELIVRPGQRLSNQYHEHRSESWTGIKGHGYCEMELGRIYMTPGITLSIDPLEKHRLVNHSPDMLHILEIWFGDDLREDDIIRVEDDYNR